MARLFDDAQNEYLGHAGAVLTDMPFVMACWFNSDTITIGQTLMSIATSDSNFDYFYLGLMGHIANDPVRITVNHTTARFADTTTSYSANTWHHACGLCVTATDRRVFLNGGGKGTNADSMTPAGMDLTTIGYHRRPSPLHPMSGMIAEAAIWDLSVWPGATSVIKANNFEKIIASLAKGFSPSHFPLGLKAYWPLVRGLNDKVGGYNITADGTVVVSHPRVILPHGAQ